METYVVGTHKKCSYKEKMLWVLIRGFQQKLRQEIYQMAMSRLLVELNAQTKHCLAKQEK